MYNSEKKHWRGKGFFFFIFIVAAMAGVGAVVMALWNAILPGLVHVSEISYWHAVGLLILCRILFGGFRFGSGGHRRWGNSRWKERWGNMSEEEKAALRSKWEEKCRSWKK